MTDETEKSDTDGQITPPVEQIKPDKPRVTTQDLSDKIDKLVGFVKGVADRVDEIETRQTASPDIRMARLKEEEERRSMDQRKLAGRPQEEINDMIEIPVAPGYIEDLNSILGPDYGISLQQGRYGTNFLVTIFVPRRDSALSEDEWRVRKCDPRSKVIPAGNAVQGFREFCYKVKANVARHLLTNPSRPLHDTDNILS